MERVTLMLGRDHATWGEFSLVESSDGLSAAALSVGASPASPSMSTKGSRIFPNEDALLLVDRGERVLFAVADAHHGHASSHAVLTTLFARCPDPPETPAALALCLNGMTIPDETPGSATTLVVAVHDRVSGQGFGLSFGDSSVVRVDRDAATFLNVRLPRYLEAGARIDVSGAMEFRFSATPDCLLAAFTDGIDECHYRSPATSVTPADLHALYLRCGPRTGDFARELMSLALGGVGGNPGGEDNIALVVCTGGLEGGE